MVFDRDPIKFCQLPSQDYTARKTHKCWECGGDIEPGQRYRVSKWIIDGKFQTMKQHLDRGGCGKSLAKAEADEQAALLEYQKALDEHYINQFSIESPKIENN